MKMKRQTGFTLIELVIVIIILGILSVTAAPKFLDLQDDAKKATLQAMSGAMKTASDTIHAKALIAGTEDAASSTITLSNGQTVTINLGYPQHDWTNAWDELLDGTFGTANPCTSDFCYDASEDITGDVTATNHDGTTAFIIYPRGKSNTSKCYAYYAYDQNNSETTTIIEPPIIGVVSTGC